MMHPDARTTPRMRIVRTTRTTDASSVLDCVLGVLLRDEVLNVVMIMRAESRASQSILW